MKYKYDPGMRTSLSSVVKELIKTFYFSMPDLFIKPEDIESRAVFVVGCGHSGTTLLATILSRHPDFFSIGYESEVFLPAKGLLFSRRTIVSWDLLTRQHGKKLFVEKTPKHALCLKRIFRIVPDARVLFIVRDGRDNVASLKERFGGFDIALDRWITDNKPAIDWREDPRVLVIKYEDLVGKPADTVESICEFLEIDSDASMLTSQESPYKNISEKNMAVRAEQVGKPIHDNTGRWRKDLDPGEVEAFWKKAGITMKALGY